MSEFQQYQFKAIDQPLTSKQQSEVNSWSKRTIATATSATFVYHYGNYFPVSEKAALTEYFDALLYVSNWGTRRLIFRFPSEFVEEEALKQYCIANNDGMCYIKMSKVADKILWEFNIDEEEHDEWVEEDDYQLGDLTPLREQILSGDYRPLFLAWLRVAQEIQMIKEIEEEEWDMKSPPIPENLKHLNAPLKAFIDYFRIDEDWVTAAAAYSKDQVKPALDYQSAIDQLTEDEKMDFLMRLAKGEARLDIQFRKKLEDLIPLKQRPQESTIAIQDILGLSEEKMAERVEEEKLRAQKAYENRMQKIVEEESLLWQQVVEELEYKRGNAYARATDTLKDLKEMCLFFGKQKSFEQKMEEILRKYGSSPALMRRLGEAGIIAL